MRTSSPLAVSAKGVDERPLKHGSSKLHRPQSYLVTPETIVISKAYFIGDSQWAHCIMGDIELKATMNPLNNMKNKLQPEIVIIPTT